MQPVTQKIVLLLLAMLFVGCTRSIELVGSGREPDVQHGISAMALGNHTIGTGDLRSAEIHVTNTSNEIISINQSVFAISVILKRDRHIVPPTGIITRSQSQTIPVADDFAILAPGQTRIIPVPLSFRGDECTTFSNVYRLEKNSIYDIEIVINPYSEIFTERDADKILTKLEIPNYLRYSIGMNTLTVRIRPIFR